MSQPERGGVVVVRVWIDDAHDEPLRARITLVDDLEAGVSESVVACSPEAILDAVRGFLEAFGLTR